MTDIRKLAHRASSSAFYLWIFNNLISRVVPFNKPHGFRITDISDDRIRVLLPYRKKNLNHIRGLHACALATLTEFAAGLLLLLKLGTSDYRIILQKLTMEYHYQGKMDAVAEFSLTDQWIKEQIRDVLIRQETVTVACQVKIYDVNGNHLSTGESLWQLKPWSKVKTKA